MNQKILWKIEEVWNKYYKAKNGIIAQISSNYDENNISKYYSEFKKVSSFSFTGSLNFVHSDTYGEYTGLKKSQLLFHDNKPIYLFDNHNKMIYPIIELFEAKSEPLNIVHIDAHPDDAKFQGIKKNSLGLENIEDYINETKISDFFDALSKTKIINKIFPITHSDSFEFFLPPEESYVLSLDIDIFGPEGDFCELKDKVRAIALAWARADAICIATSPGFIDQDFAREIVEIFLKNK